MEHNFLMMYKGLQKYKSFYAGELRFILCKKKNIAIIIMKSYLFLYKHDFNVIKGRFFLFMLISSTFLKSIK